MPVKVLLLGYPPLDSGVGRFLRGETELLWTDRPPYDLPVADWLISYGYRHILKPRHLDRFAGRAINLHISFLPYNRGADPNLWSWVEGTPKGVTIHYLDHGVDTGDIIAQEVVCMGDEVSLIDSYQILRDCMDALFIRWWPMIRDGLAPRRQQPKGGSVHRKADRASIEYLLTKGWDTPVRELQQERGNLCCELSSSR